MSLFDQWVRLPKVMQYILWFNLIGAVLVLIYLNWQFTPHSSVVFNIVHYGVVVGVGGVLMKWSNVSKRFYSNQSKVPIYIGYVFIVLLLLGGIYWIKSLFPISS